MWNKGTVSLRSIPIQAFLTLVALVAALLMGEMALRAYRVLKDRTVEPLRFIEREANGFRMFGNVNATRPKLLFIGDSFTQADNLPANQTYAALLAKALHVEVFSYGGGGFGTLQELMVLEDVIDKINPNVVILQFCSNDFINNSFELESKSSINNNRMVRPYLSSSGEIVYRNPSFESAFLSDLLQTSRLFSFLANRLYVPFGESIEGVVARNPSHPEFRASVAVTQTLLDRLKHKVGNERELLVFTADGARTRIVTLPEQYQIYAGVAEQALVQILTTLRIPLIPGVPDALVDMEAKGAVVKAFDGAHWNELGHKLVAEEIQKSAVFTRIFQK